MRIIHENQEAVFSYQADPGMRVHANQPLRQVEALVDFRFVRATAAHPHKGRGHLSTDPVGFMKLIFFQTPNQKRRVHPISHKHACLSATRDCPTTTSIPPTPAAALT